MGGLTIANFFKRFSSFILLIISINCFYVYEHHYYNEISFSLLVNFIKIQLN